MKYHYKYILIAALIMVGISAFISGEFIISSVLFATAALSSTVYRTELQSADRN